MTGRELIIYILENKLEDEPILINSKILGFLSIEEAALKYNVGPETVRIWIELNMIPGIKLGDQFYIPANIVKQGVE